MRRPKLKLLSKRDFLIILVLNFIIGMFLIALALVFGMWGYHFYEHMSWVDAFANAAMILSGMGPLATLTTSSGKVFAGLYALFSGLLFIVILGIIFGPIIHRFLHRFHLDMAGDEEDGK